MKRAMMRLGRAIVIAALTLPLCSCQGWQSSLDPQGPKAEAIADLFWIFTAVCMLVWVFVVAFLAAAIWRRHGERPDPLATDAAQERRFTIVVSTFVALTAVTLIALTAFSYAGQKGLFDRHEGRINLKIVGHQWWWEVRYQHPEPQRSFTTANEIHIPVGEPVRIELESSDVIHSFWVPSLMGKQDLITGRQNLIQIQADREGVYRGQCAEFCGLQHAHMSFLVVARPREEFEAWRNQQISARQPPQDEERQEGERVFLSNPCVMCHTVRGTSAGGKVGPDLTHVGSRQYIASGTLPTSRGTLAAWIVDPHSVKPGVHMPLIKLQSHELHPLVSYLDGLK
jgi:cytochrome c oxidase subunit II